MNTIQTTPADATGAGRPTIRLAKAWASGTVAAIALVAAVFLLADRISGPLTVEGAGAVTLDIVTGFTLFGATIGVGLAWLAGRFARRPRLAFLVATLAGLAGYAVVPFLAADAVSTAVWLNLFHIVVAVPVIGMLARVLPTERAGRTT